MQIFGSPEKLKSRMLTCIEPKVRTLEGGGVTRQLQVGQTHDFFESSSLTLLIIGLDEILAAQEPEWLDIGGYAYVTSQQAEEHWRPYVGQVPHPARFEARHRSSLRTYQHAVLLGRL